MKKKIIVFGILSMLLLTAFASTASSLAVSIGNENISDYLIKPTNLPPCGSEIYIKGNEQFNTYSGVTIGSGTENDPYIIEGWTVQRITIEDTTAYFVIRNCDIRGNWETFVLWGNNHVTFSGVENGIMEKCTMEWLRPSLYTLQMDMVILIENSINIKIIDCSTLNAWIRMYNSHYCKIDNFIIKDNLVHSAANALILEDSNNNEISNLKTYAIFNTVIFMSNSDSNVIHHCYIGYIMGWRGFDIDENCDNNIIHHNTIYGDNQYRPHGAGCTAQDKGTNIWYEADTNEGNYWKGYTEIYPDATNDGTIWNKPYEILGGNNVDPYPLVEKPVTQLKSKSFDLPIITTIVHRLIERLLQKPFFN